MTYLAVYLLVGVLNYLWFALFRVDDTLWMRGWREGLVEMLFFVLLWPVQVAFWLLVGLHNATGWVLERIMG